MRKSISRLMENLAGFPFGYEIPLGETQFSSAPLAPAHTGRDLRPLCDGGLGNQVSAFPLGPASG